jgi:flagellar FliL protein
MADEQETEGGTEEAPSGGKGKLIGIVAVVALVAAAAGYGGATFMATPAEPAPSEELADAGAEGEEMDEGSSKMERTVVALKPFTVNLRGGGGGRMLRLEVQLEIDSKHAEAFELKKPVLRDAVLTLVSDQTYADLEGLDGKTHLRDALLRRLNAVLEDIRIQRVYFTDFVVQ